MNADGTMNPNATAAMSVAQPTTVPALLNGAAEGHPDVEALVVGGERRTYRQLRAEAELVAGGLLAAGVRPGDRVCLFAPNIVQSYVALFATAKAGAVFVPLNPRLTERELRLALERSQAAALLFIPEYSGVDYIARLRGIYPQLLGGVADSGAPQLLITLKGQAAGSISFEELVAAGGDNQRHNRQQQVEAALRPTDPALLQFTSGTTSTPKAALLAHGPTARMAFELGERFGLLPQDRYFGCPPICHLGGTTFSLLTVISHHATFVTLPVFEAGLALVTMEAERCTIVHGIDSHLRLQISHPDFNPSRLSLRLVSVSAVAQTVRDVARAFGGVVVISQYGSTEAGAAPVCAAWNDSVQERLDSVGRALPDVTLEIVNPATGLTVPAGETGEIRLGGWSLMVGYLDQPIETAELYDDSERMKTGDLGYLDERGYLHFTGRLKNMLRSGGENVSLEEVETVITDFPGAAFAVVVPIPDERLGEVGFAFVGCDQPEGVDVELLRAHCLRQLAKFKVPRYFQFEAVTDIPMTGNGKVDRRELQTRASLRLRT